MAFVASALLAACGCVVAGLAITVADFWMFCGAACCWEPTTRW